MVSRFGGGVTVNSTRNHQLRLPITPKLASAEEERVALLGSLSSSPMARVHQRKRSNINQGFHSFGALVTREAFEKETGVPSDQIAATLNPKKCDLEACWHRVSCPQDCSAVIAESGGMKHGCTGTDEDARVGHGLRTLCYPCHTSTCVCVCGL